MKKFFVVLIMFTLSCNRDTLTVNQYTDGIKKYLTTTFQISPERFKSNGVFILPLSSCTPCLQSTLKFIGTLQSKTVIVFTIGTSDASETNQLLEIVKKKFQTYQDTNGDLKYFRTNIGTPYYFEMRKNGEFYGVDLNDQNIGLLKGRKILK
ncbi:MAG: hypothetical protein WC865_07730 [Bacteroidales bacterium]